MKLNSIKFFNDLKNFFTSNIGTIPLIYGPHSIYLIPHFLLIFVAFNDIKFLKNLLKKWRTGKKLFKFALSSEKGGFIKKRMIAFKNYILSKKIIENFNYQIVFFEWGSILLKQVINLFKFKCPVIVRMHRYELFDKLIYKINFNKINSIILVSEFMKTVFLRKFPNLEKKIVLISNAVKLDAFQPIKNKKTSFKISTLSNLITRKRIDLVIAAMESIKNPRVKLYIGGSGNIKDELEKKIEEKKLENRIIFDGYIKNVPEWFQDKDVIINSSEIESFGVSLIEAMACEVFPLIRGWNAAKDLYPKECILLYNKAKFVKELTSRIDEFYDLGENIRNFKRKLVRQFVAKNYSFENQVQYFNKLFLKYLS